MSDATIHLISPSFLSLSLFSLLEHQKTVCIITDFPVKALTGSLVNVDFGYLEHRTVALQ